MTEKEELKPCPYHGDHNAMQFSSVSKKYAACMKCSTPSIGIWYRPVEDWNNAWAHREINILKSNIKQLCVDQLVQLNSLESKLKIAEEALRYCAVDPGYLRSENNSQHIVAMNALSQINTGAQKLIKI